MKLRKFEVDNGKLVVSDKGEWIHENDVLLMLQNSRDEINGMIRYSKDMIKATGGSKTIPERTNLYSILSKHILEIYDKTVNHICSIRGIMISFNNVIDSSFEEYDLFSDEEKLKEERKLEETINSLKKKYGKNSVLRGMNFEDKATTRTRNLLIGGHNSGEEE